MKKQSFIICWTTIYIQRSTLLLIVKWVMVFWTFPLNVFIVPDDDHDFVVGIYIYNLQCIECAVKNLIWISIQCNVDVINNYSIFDILWLIWKLLPCVSLMSCIIKIICWYAHSAFVNQQLVNTLIGIFHLILYYDEQTTEINII